MNATADGKDDKKETRTKNYLNDFDWCLRKAIAVYVISKEMRPFSDLSQESFTHDIEKKEQVRIDPGTLSKWMSPVNIANGKIVSKNDDYKRVPTFGQLMAISAHIKKPVQLMIREAVEEDKKSKNSLLGGSFADRAKTLSKELKSQVKKQKTFQYEAKSSDHLKRILKFERSRYIGFFLSASARNSENGPRVEHFVLETSDTLETAAVQCLMRVFGKAEDSYRCNIVSPPNRQNYVYIYLRQDTGNCDRGMMVFRVPSGIQNFFQCGMGFLLSNRREDGLLGLQNVIILRIGETIGEDLSAKLDERNAASMLRAMQKRGSMLNAADLAFENTSDLRQTDRILREELLKMQSKWSDGFLCIGDLKERHDEVYKLYEEQIENKLCLEQRWNETHQKD